MGAYELSCDTNVSSEWDWVGADGLVNLAEFQYFSRCWLTHDPNSPLCDPNYPGYVSDPNAPGYITENAKANWNPKYDLNADLTVNLVDLLYWIDEAPWLWRACWVNLPETQPQQMMAGGEMLLMGDFESMTLQTEAVPEKPVQERMLETILAIVQLEQIWLEEPDIQQQITLDAWQRFMNTLYQDVTSLYLETQ